MRRYSTRSGKLLCWHRGFTYAYAVFGNVAAGTTLSHNGYYSIMAAVGTISYMRTATPVGGQTGDTTCASFELSNSGQSATDAGGTDQTKTCWGSR